MKMILGFIRPFKLDEVTLQLERIPHFPGMTVTEARGFGREHMLTPAQSVAEELEEFTDKVKIETIVRDEQVEEVLAVIARSAHTGRDGDGMIFVIPVERAVRIATGQGAEDHHLPYE